MLKFNSGQIAIPIIIILLVVTSYMLAGGLSKHGLKIRSTELDSSGKPITTAPGGTNENLQLKSFGFIKNTPIPTVTTPPVNTCNHDNGQQADPACKCAAYLLECAAKKCVKVLPSELLPNGGTCQDIGQVDSSISHFGNWCGVQELAGDGNGIYCLGKPVIYLYPTQKTIVNVSVETPGKIVISDPLYPEGGWKNVEANPDGSLIYKDKKYSELFYESEINEFLKPTKGIIIADSQLENKLDKLIYQLGLNNSEKKEFLDFWLPKLHSLNYPYIVFSVIDTDAKEAIDQINISPEPETRIEFIAYFKPLSTLTPIETLTLPKRPERIGFTAVEWGGVIDSNSHAKIK